MSQSLRKKLEKEERSRREAEELLGERSIDLLRAQAEIQKLRNMQPAEELEELRVQIIAAIHEPMKPLLESVTQLFSQLPPQADMRQIEDEIRQELARLVDALRSLDSSVSEVTPAS